MVNSEQGKNGRIAQRFRSAFQPRDVFLHDGRSLRQFRLGRRVQLAATGALTALVAWSGFATVSYATAAPADVSSMQRQVAAMQQDVAQIRAAAQERAQLLEQRQAFLQAVLSGEARPEQVAALVPPAPEAQDGHAHEVSQAYAEVDNMQLMLAAQAEAATRQRIQRTAAVVRRLGINPTRLTQGGVGGPFEEAGAADLGAAGDADPRFAQLFSSWRQMERLEQGVASIPSSMPVNGARWTSSFGIRSDPFRGRAAMHSGIDMAGPVGTPIYATADGTVGRAESAGAYGNLIELQHGAGIATRYGHLSRILVQPGTPVRRGQLIGLMGSTGRSTGSHLHYEVRIDGRAINPAPFLESGRALAALQAGASGGAQGGAR
jgi:murein DD-endopeptidase MepM/ murein hydrolase activator NlpD